MTFISDSTKRFDRDGGHELASNQLSSRVAGQEHFCKVQQWEKGRWAAAVTGLLKNAPAFTVVWNPEAIRVDLVTKRLFNAV